MRYYPLFIDLAEKRVLFSGAGLHAAAKIRLLLKTEVRIEVYGDPACDEILDWAQDGRLVHFPRCPTAADADGATLVYGANDDPEMDRAAVDLGKAAGALTNIVDNLDESEFLTPALVDRDPVTIAIGTEGTAPVLARKIKSEIEELLPASTGLLAQIASAFRPKAAQLTPGRPRRNFWTDFFFRSGPRALAESGRSGAQAALEKSLVTHLAANDTPPQGSVAFVGSGPGDPDLMTVKARRHLHEADVVLHDRLVAPEILELARREATVVDVGKKGFGPGVAQEEINRQMVEHARSGAQVVRLKSGDPVIFGRLEEEIEALDAAGIGWDIVPGITSASAAAAGIGASLTRRGRNASIRLLTGHDAKGFAEQDWKALALPGAAAAIYMGLKAAAFIRGRLLIHGASPATVVTVIVRSSRPDQQVIETNLLDLPTALDDAAVTGPAILFLGIAARRAVSIGMRPATGRANEAGAAVAGGF